MGAAARGGRELQALFLAALLIVGVSGTGGRQPEFECYEPEGRRRQVPCEYHVVKKEWLGKIADHYGSVTISDIWALNPAVANMKTAPGKSVLRLPCQSPAISGTSVIDLLQHRPDMSLFVRMAEAAGMKEELSDPEWEGTVFAPSNCAVKALLADLDVTEKLLLSNSLLLDTVLSYHVLDGPVLTSTELAAAAAAEDPELETLLKQPLQVRATPRGRRKAPRLELVTATDQVLRIVRRDLRGGAAVVHIINDVALPVREPAPESFMARRRRLQGRHAQPGAVAAQHA